MVSERIPFYVPLMNPLMKSLLRIGVPMGPMMLLTVKGRRTGRRLTTPVGVFDDGGRRYIFGTFGEVDWVRNLRRAGEAVLSRGRHNELVAASELTPHESASVLEQVLGPYLSSQMRSRFLRMGYDFPKNPTTDDFAREARRHPGFELMAAKRVIAPRGKSPTEANSESEDFTASRMASAR
jgi:deazaflavin-dependent oxidoreductase (nitroreductase family)